MLFRLVTTWAIAASLAAPGAATAKDWREHVERDAEEAREARLPDAERSQPESRRNAERAQRESQRDSERLARDVQRGRVEVSTVRSGPTTFEETRVDYNTANDDLIVSNGTTTVRDSLRTDSKGNLLYMASSETRTRGTVQESGLTYSIRNRTRDVFAAVQTRAGDSITVQIQRERRTIDPIDGPSSAKQTVSERRVEVQRNGEPIVSRSGHRTTCGERTC